MLKRFRKGAFAEGSEWFLIKRLKIFHSQKKRKAFIEILATVVAGLKRTVRGGIYILYGNIYEGTPVDGA
ncbi:MAG TPA: hypothetical protein DD706_09620 [Nitrospiraceae bacterium]|nr:hypothetical protein [Nitrospiraceae bacterium]